MSKSSSSKLNSYSTTKIGIEEEKTFNQSKISSSSEELKVEDTKVFNTTALPTSNEELVLAGKEDISSTKISSSSDVDCSCDTGCEEPFSSNKLPTESSTKYGKITEQEFILVLQGLTCTYLQAYLTDAQKCCLKCNIAPSLLKIKNELITLLL